MGTFEVHSSDGISRAPDNTEVSVKVEVLGVTKIDSEEKTAGLHMKLTLDWQDPRIVFQTRKPRVNEEFEAKSGLT